MKLLLLNPPPALVREMNLRNHELMIVDRWISPLEAELSGPNCEFVRLTSAQKISFAASRKLRAMIRRFQPDVIHAFFSPASLSQVLLGCWGLRERPRIVSYRGITRVPSRFDPGEWLACFSRRVSVHACESIAVKQALIAGGVADEKCVVVYNCIARSKAAVNVAELRRQLNIPLDAFVVGTVAWIRPIKGVDILLKAAAQCASLAKVYFLVVGDCKDGTVAELARDSRLQGRLIMTGRMPNASRMMKAFDVFVMASRQEALCRALLEAMEQAVCPIVSDAGGMKEMVRHDRDGLVFPTENVLALCEHIKRLHGDRTLLAGLGQSAQQRVRDVCSPASFADRLEAIYQTAVVDVGNC